MLAFRAVNPEAVGGQAGGEAGEPASALGTSHLMMMVTVHDPAHGAPQRAMEVGVQQGLEDLPEEDRATLVDLLTLALGKPDPALSRIDPADREP